MARALDVAVALAPALGDCAALVALAMREEATITLQAAARRRAVQYRMRSPFYRVAWRRWS